MEGGIRQTAVVQWPGTIAAGVASNWIFTFWDFLPTAAALAGIDAASGGLPQGIDGISALPAMLGGGLVEEALAPAPAPRALYVSCLCWGGASAYSYYRGGGHHTLQIFALTYHDTCNQ